MSSDIVYQGGQPQRLSRGTQRALDAINGRGEVTRQADIDRARTVGGRIDLHAALGIHTMQRGYEVIEERRALAKEDPYMDVELMRFQNAAFRNMEREQNRLFNPFS